MYQKHVRPKGTPFPYVQYKSNLSEDGKCMLQRIFMDLNVESVNK